MNKFKRGLVFVLLIIFFCVIVVLSLYNSIHDLFYVRRTILNTYSFMLPKNLGYYETYNEGSIYINDIISGSLVVFDGEYDLAKKLSYNYNFYGGQVIVLDEVEKEIDGKKLYYISKEIFYSDNDSNSYFFNYIYSFSDDKCFVISVECYTIEKLEHFKKLFEKTVTSIKKY